MEESAKGLVRSAHPPPLLARCRRSVAVVGLTFLGLVALGFVARAIAGRPASWVTQHGVGKNGAAKDSKAGETRGFDYETGGISTLMQVGFGRSMLLQLPCDPSKETPTRYSEPNAVFVEYKVKVRDVVKRGEVVAIVADREGFGIPIKATVSGVVKYIYSDLDAGMKLDSIVPDKNLATIEKSASSEVPPDPQWQVQDKPDSSLPWWLFLIALVPLLGCLCGFIVASWKGSASSYNAMLTKQPEPLVEDDCQDSSDRVELVFDDFGKAVTVYAKYRPLGVKYDERVPIVVTDFPINSYAKLQLGVQVGWQLTHVGGKNVRTFSDFTDVSDRLCNAMKKLPLWPLPLEFREEDSSEPIIIQFFERPLGIQLNLRDPSQLMSGVKVTKLADNGPAQKKGVQEGWILTKIGELDLHGTQHTLSAVTFLLKEASQPLTMVQHGADV